MPVGIPSTFGTFIASAACAVLGLACAAASGQGIPSYGGSTVKPSAQDEAKTAVKAVLSLEGTALVPGKAATIGLTLEIARDWNVYWRNPGDSGLPVSAKFTAPEGVAVGEAMWPTPIREVLPGDVLDYVYRDRVTLLFPVVVSPALAPSSGAVTIEADVSWLVCREACVPGGAKVSLNVPIEQSATIGAQSALFEASRGRLPRTPAQMPSPVVTVSWSGSTLTLSCPGSEEMVFFPYEGDVQPENALEGGRVEGAGSMSLSYPSGARAEEVRGVLQVTRLGKTTFHLIEPVARSKE